MQSSMMSAISYFKICAQMNQSLIPPLTGLERARYCVKWSTNCGQIVCTVLLSLVQTGPSKVHGCNV